MVNWMALVDDDEVRTILHLVPSQEEIKTLRAEVALLSGLLRHTLEDNHVLRTKLDEVCKRKRDTEDVPAAKRAFECDCKQNK